MTKFYVYELIDPRNDLPFYIGKGNGDRMYKHVKQAFQKKGSKINPHKSSKIRQIIDEGYNITYKKYDCVDEESAFKMEGDLILKHGCVFDKSGILTNLTFGGEGYSGGHIPVCQFNMYGEFIKQYRSAKDAAEYLGVKYNGTITGNCRGREISAYGYLWAYIGELPILRKKIKAVYQWSLEGDMIARFPSISEAGRHVKKDGTGIVPAIKKNSIAYGYVWSWEPVFPGFVNVSGSKKVKHVNTGTIYKSVTAAATAFGHNIGAVSKCCKGNKQDINGNRFCYVDSDQ